jgi:isoleucyl-tRNA synthetase
MKAISGMVAVWGQTEIAQVESNKGWKGVLEGETLVLELDDFEIVTEDIPGWSVATEGALTVALDVHISEELKNEGIARELINRVQNLRKDSGLEVTDKIVLSVDTTPANQLAIKAFESYIQNEVLARSIAFKSLTAAAHSTDLIADGDTQIEIVLAKP